MARSGSGEKLPSNNDAKKRKCSSDEEHEDDFACDECPICFESYTYSGKHQLCALDCGHLFGKSCLWNWLTKRKACPLCREHAKDSQIKVVPIKLSDSPNHLNKKRRF